MGTFNGGEHVWFECPGCGENHRVVTRASSGPVWGYNGDPERPTFTPSILVTWEGMRDGQEVRKVCHSFVRDGRIEFLGDCTHAMAGQTVDLPEWPYDDDDDDDDAAKGGGE